MPKYLLVWSFLLSCLLQPVSAQTIFDKLFKKWEFSAFYGFSSAGDDVHPTPRGEDAVEPVGLSFAQGYVVGGRITENLGEHFGAELEYGFTNQPARFDRLSPTISDLELDHRVHKAAYSILFYPLSRNSPIRPYGSVGLGASFYQVTSESEQEALTLGADLRNRWKLALSYGAGVKAALGSQWGVRGDFRDHVTGVPDFGLPPRANPTGTGPAFRPSGRVHNWQVSVGLFYMLNFR